MIESEVVNATKNVFGKEIWYLGMFFQVITKRKYLGC